MSDYAIMPLEDLQDACDAIRTKTGTTALIKSGEMAGLISGISGGSNEILNALIEGTLTELSEYSTTVGDEVFYNYDSLTSISLPACTSIGVDAFSYCSNLMSINLPVCTSIGGRAFAYCSSITSISLPACTSIGVDAFSYCKNLTSLYLTGSSLCTLDSVETFNGTPIAGDTESTGCYGYIYVPASLLEAYKTAPNWQYYSDRFKASDVIVNMIEFSIDGAQYQAEEGMTWDEWIYSGYQNNEYSNGGVGVMRKSDNAYVSIYAEDSDSLVSMSDIITSKAYYVTTDVDGGK